ncbi:MAG: regulatory protein RecX [Mariprofundus sp.]|nr:regulatory protein RecX [Mariprofundus sp.]
MNKEQSAAYLYAVRLLVRREYCTSQIQQKLHGREHDAEIIVFVIEKLKADGYLNDQRFAELYLSSRLDKGEAPWLAARRAQQKGADETSIQLAMDELTADYDADQVASDLLAGRDPAGFRFEDERTWQRLARFLRNKGFASDVILRVLKQRE